MQTAVYPAYRMWPDTLSGFATPGLQVVEKIPRKHDIKVELPGIWKKLIEATRLIRRGCVQLDSAERLDAQRKACIKADEKIDVRSYS